MFRIVALTGNRNQSNILLRTRSVSLSLFGQSINYWQKIGQDRGSIVVAMATGWLKRYSWDKLIHSSAAALNCLVPS